MNWKKDINPSLGRINGPTERPREGAIVIVTNPCVSIKTDSPWEHGWRSIILGYIKADNERRESTRNKTTPPRSRTRLSPND